MGLGHTALNWFQTVVNIPTGSGNQRAALYPFSNCPAHLKNYLIWSYELIPYLESWPNYLIPGYNIWYKKLNKIIGCTKFYNYNHNEKNSNFNFNIIVFKLYLYKYNELFDHNIF